MSQVANVSFEDEDLCSSGSLLDRPDIRWTFVVIYVLVFFACFVGNAFLLVVVCCRPSMRTATNFFLANLAIADLMVAVFCILQNMGHLLLFKYSYWPLGALMCYLYLFVLHLVPSVSAGLLVLVSIEKYLALRYPLFARHILSNNLRVSLTVCVWLLAIVSNIPFYMLSRFFTMDGQGICIPHDATSADFERQFIRVSFTIWYCVPVLVMACLYTSIGYMLCTGHSTILHNNGCNQRSNSGRVSKASNIHRGGSNAQHKFSSVSTRSTAAAAMNAGGPDTNQMSTVHSNDVHESRRKVARLLVAVVLSFACLTLPHHVRLLWRYSRPKGYHYCNSSWVALAQPVTYLLLFINSAINPLLYAFMSQRFRLACTELVCFAFQTADLAQSMMQMQPRDARSADLHRTTVALVPDSDTPASTMLLRTPAPSTQAHAGDRTRHTSTPNVHTTCV